MTALAAILTLILAAETTAPAKRLGPDAPNSVRARAGLLPRKVPRARAGIRPRLRTVSAPAPTFLAEPVPLAEAPPEPRPDPRPAAAAHAVRAPVGPAVPEEIGTLRFAVRGVSTEVTLRLRFDP